MEIFPITVGSLDTNCYILYDNMGQGVIIDPGADPELILAQIDKKKLNIEKIILTHGHFDHIGGADTIKAKTGAKIAIHNQDEELLLDGYKNLSRMMGADYKLEGVDILLEEGDTIQIGNDKLYVIHTPGHTKGGLCLLLEGRGIFTGDTLFMYSVGRTDFYGGDHDILIKSIIEKIMPLDDHLMIYPGHGPTSTIGNERSRNPYIKQFK